MHGTACLLSLRFATVYSEQPARQNWRMRLYVDFHLLLAPGAPSNLHAYALSETSIKVMWSKPADPNGVITGYTVRPMNI